MYHESVATPSLHGIVPALVTPFREDGCIDYGAWQAIIDALIAAGVDGLFAAGSQGEFFSLDTEERRVVLRFSAQAVAGRVPLYGNVGCVTTRDTIELAQQAEAEGVDVLVVITPYCIKPSPQELAGHYIEVCRAARFPVLGYNVPYHSGIDLAPETVAQIAAGCENFAGLVDCSGNLEWAAACRNSAPERSLAIFTGCDPLVLPAFEQGSVGAATPGANVAPRLFVDLYAAFREGNREKAARLQALADELGLTLALHTFPAVVKEAMQMAGLPAGPCRKPVGPVPPEVRQKVAGVLARLRGAGYLSNAAQAVA